jgi:colicin import membrane protein
LRTDWTISIVAHVAAVAVGLVTITGTRPPARELTDFMPVNIVSDVTQITQGERSAEKLETQKPLAEKVEEAKPVEHAPAKPAEKKEVNAAREPPPAPEAKPAEQKPDMAKAEAKPDPVTERAKEQEKQERKPEPKRTEAKPPMPPRKPAPPAPRFDPSQVAALLDKQQATRLAAAGPALNPAASLGAPTGKATQLSLSELDALRQRLAQLWSIPAGARDPQELVVVFRIKLKRDGTLDGWPTLVSSGKTPLSIAARESAARALNRGQPYDMLRPETYELWKDIEITFDPRDMIRQ